MTFLLNPCLYNSMDMLESCSGGRVWAKNLKTSHHGSVSDMLCKMAVGGVVGRWQVWESDSNGGEMARGLCV